MSDDEDKTVEQRAIEYLEDNDDWHRAANVAEAIDSGTDYTRSVLNALHQGGEVAKRRKGLIIGTFINGTFVVADSKEQARTIIRIHGEEVPSNLNSMNLSELRAYIKGNIGDWTGPIGKKVWYALN